MTYTVKLVFLLFFKVKETGAVIYNCSCIASDLQKIFDVYWLMGAPDAKVPPSWPSSLATKYNLETPMEVYYNNTYARSYLSVSMIYHYIRVFQLAAHMHVGTPYSSLVFVYL